MARLQGEIAVGQQLSALALGADLQGGSFVASSEVAEGAA
jgi:hypothetical protein